METLKIAILDDYQSVALLSAEQGWTNVRSHPQLNVTIDTFTKPIPANDLAAVLHPYSIICTMRERTAFDAKLISSLPNLKLLTTTGPINRALDLEAAERYEVIVAGTGATGNATLEHIWALILAVARKIPQYDRSLKDPTVPWQSIGPSPPINLPIGLMGKTLGIVGFGRLGAAVAKIADAFGMSVIAWSQNLTADRLSREQQDYVSIVSKRELFETADFVSVHLVLSSRSQGIIGAEDLALMKPSAILINTSRGPIIDEEALLHVVRTGKIRGVGIDVFHEEPLPEDSEWRKLGDKVVITPHVGYVETRNYEKFWEDTTWNINVWLDGREDYVYKMS